MKKVLCTVGTRPEAIKMAPVISALREASDFEARVLFTGQHRDLLDQVDKFFTIAPDRDLAVMQAGQSLPTLTARLTTRIDEVLADEAPDAVLAQGDTTTVLVTGLCCYYRRIPFGHVEAGLRTGDLFSPFPEEANRRLVGPLARWHFAPTARARDNLLREGLAPETIHLTGNTVVDALHSVMDRELPLPVAVADAQPLLLVTLHRRESFGPKMRGIMGAIRRVAERRPDALVVYPVHPNPQVQGMAHEVFAGLENVRLIAPVGYGEFLGLMKRATLTLTDSGGVQEEAPSFGLPVLVLRDTTERPEGVDAGVAKLVGTDPAAIETTALKLLDDPGARAAMRTAGNPYGDGRASRRILEALRG